MIRNKVVTKKLMEDETEVLVLEKSHILSLAVAFIVLLPTV